MTSSHDQMNANRNPRTMNGSSGSDGTNRPTNSMGPFSLLLMGTPDEHTTHYQSGVVAGSNSSGSDGGGSHRSYLENVHVREHIRDAMSRSRSAGGRDMSNILHTMERLQSGNSVDDEYGDDDDEEEGYDDDDDDEEEESGAVNARRQLSVEEFQRQFDALSSSSESDDGDGDNDNDAVDAVGDTSGQESGRRKADKGKSVLTRQELEELEEDLFGVDNGRRRRRSKKHRRRHGGGGRRKQIPDNITQLLGDANLHFINLEYKEAIDKLLEVVRLMPTIPDAYHILALIAEEMQQPKRALEYLLLAALLTPKDVDLWKRLAIMAQEQDNIQQTVYCLNRVIKLEPRNVDAAFDLAVLHTQLGNQKKAIDSYERVLKVTPDDFQVVVQLARLYHEENVVGSAVELLENTVNRNLQTVDYTVVNMLLEEYMNMGKFELCVTVVEEMLTQRNMPTVLLPAEIRVKDASCKAYMGRIEEACVVFNDVLFNLEIGQYMDLFFDIAETLYAVKEYSNALQAYTLLLSVELYNKPALWLKIAECYRYCKELNQAIQFYEMVLRDVPSNVDARIALSEIYKQMGRLDEAARVLGNDYTFTTETLRRLLAPEREGADMEVNQAATTESNPSHVEDIRIVSRQAWMLYESKKLDEFLDLAVPLIQTILSITKTRKRGSTRVYVSRQSAQADLEQKRQEEKLAKDMKKVNWTWQEAEDALGPETLVELIFTTCRSLAERKRFTVAYRIMYTVLDKRLVTDREHVKNLRYLLLGIAFNSNDYTKAYHHCRTMLMDNVDSMPLWNLFNKISLKTGKYQSQQKFLIRQLHKHPNNLPLMILTANNSCANGSYRLALGEYVRAYLKSPEEPLINLCIGVNYLNLVMNRRTANRHLLVIQAFTFLYRYYDIMKGNQEANYNLARAYHQLGINHLAMYYYENVLLQSRAHLRDKDADIVGDTIADTINLMMGYDVNAKDTSTGADTAAAVELEEEEEEDLQESTSSATGDLKFEAAHNLVLLYRASGNDDLARRVMLDHLTI